MLGYDHLALGLFQLKPSEEWLSRGPGFSFLFPKEGLGTFASAAINHPLASGDVLVCSEAQGGQVCAMEAGELVCWHFSFCLEHLYPLLGGDELSLLQNLPECFRTPRLYPSSSPLAQECHRLLAAAPPGHRLDHRGQLLRVVTAILAEEFKDLRSQRGGLGGAGQDMIHMLGKLTVEDITGFTAQELADKFHWTRRHLGRLFQQHFGLSLTALKMEIRLIKAMTLLRNRNLKVNHVAKECGFSHLGLFNSCFKRRFGASPGHWRDANNPAKAHPAGLINGEPLCRMQASGMCPWAGKAPGIASISSRPARLSTSPRVLQGARSGDDQHPEPEGRMFQLRIQV